MSKSLQLSVTPFPRVPWALLDAAALHCAQQTLQAPPGMLRTLPCMVGDDKSDGQHSQAKRERLLSKVTHKAIDSCLCHVASDW